jgi:hypothetical protein
MSKKAKAKIEAPASMGALLNEVLTKKGMINSCFKQFHNYSFNNLLLAYFQIEQLKKDGHDVSFGPMATYKRWAELGRKVKAAPEGMGGKWGIVMCQPIAFQKKEFKKGEAEMGVFYKYSRKWFAMSQTDEVDPQNKEDEIPNWDAKIAMEKLEIELVDFEYHDGNCMGYATGRKIAINPICKIANMVKFHEIAHIVLGHTIGNVMADNVEKEKSMKEVEAESVAYILGSINGESEKNLTMSRGYIQGWFSANKLTEIPAKNATNIFTAVETILKAGSNKAAVKEAAKEAAAIKAAAK